MVTRAPVRRLLLIVNLGFACTIGISWLDEIVDLPGLLFGKPEAGPNWHEGIIETAIVLLAWLAVTFAVRKLGERLYYLEKFLRVCAWCRKIHYEGQWIPIEEYFRKGFSTDTTHGMCPECADLQLRKYEKSKQHGAPPEEGPGDP